MRESSGASTGLRYVVEPIGKKQADRWISERHYSGSAVWASHTHLVVRDGSGSTVGMMQFGPSMNPRATSKVIEGLEPRALVELNRMVFVDGHERNLISWSISKAMRYIREKRPYVQVVQSFADQRCHRLGAVYQAANFLYLGSHCTAFYFLDGEWFHKSLLGRAQKDNRGWGSGPKAARLAAGRDRAQKFEFEQYRYVYPLTAWARKRLLPRAIAYPKASESTHAPYFPTAKRPVIQQPEQMTLFGSWVG